MFKKLIVIFLLLLIVFNSQVVSNVKTIASIMQMFPGFPIKPLNIIPSPIVKSNIVKNGNSRIIIDVFTPVINNPNKKRPAIIIASGVRLKNNKKDFVEFANTLTKLGFIVIYPRSEKIEANNTNSESPDTFIQAYNFALSESKIDKKRISMMGFSTGASIALVAAEKMPENAFKNFIFISGYYDIFDYLENITTKSFTINGERHFWKADKNSVWLIEQILKTEKANNSRDLLDSGFFNKNKIPQDEVKLLEKYNPAKNIHNFKSEVFILHDLNDRHIPYSQSINLKNNVCVKNKCNFFLTNSFDHVKPKNNISFKIEEALSVYAFVYKLITSV